MFNDFLIAKPIDPLEVAIRILVAVVIGGVIGIEREYKNRPAGMRTHVLVCLGSMMVALLEGLLRESLMNTAGGGVALSIGRMSAQVISGIGFLGAGTIFMAQKKISGLTTAASLWNVACLGIMIGFGYYWVASIVAAFVILVLLLLQRIVKVNTIKRVEVKFFNRGETLPFINNYFETNHVTVLDVDFHVEVITDTKNIEHNIYTNIYTLHLPHRLNYIDIVTRFSEYSNIQTVRTRNT